MRNPIKLDALTLETLACIFRLYRRVAFIVMRLEAEYLDLIYSIGEFGGVHAFGYNSAVSEPIWMKSGAL